MLARDLAELMGGTAYDADSVQVVGFATDSSQIRVGEAFLAIKGNRVDGHDFVAQAHAAGASLTIAERPVEGPRIEVKNLVEALSKMAAHFRATFTGPVIGITGSAGKTSTKEFLAAALGKKVLKTVGNRNTEYTAPLLWAELEGAEEAVIVEMSMRGFGQIDHLCNFSKPNVGLITNIGPSHLEMVGSLEGVARAKAELIRGIPPDGLSILHADDPFLSYLKSQTNSKIATFGSHPDADARIVHTEFTPEFHTLIKGTVREEAFTAELPILGDHMAINALAALLTAKELGKDLGDASDALAYAELPPMRMQPLSLHGATILLDAYNASPASTIAALTTLRELPVKGRRVAVLGEMKELGEANEAGHREVGAAVAGLSEVIFIGDSMEFAAQEATEAGFTSFRIVNSLEEVRDYLDSLQPGDVALVKGSRGLELERAVWPLLEGQC